MSESRAGVTAGLALVLLLLGGCASSAHGDGEGPLGSVGEVGVATETIMARQAGIDSYSFGVYLCLSEADERAVIEAVRPADTIGSGFEALPVLAHSNSVNLGFLSLASYPPEHEVIVAPPVPAVGFEVAGVCPPTLGQLNTQLIVGLRATGVEGGGWLGVAVDYRHGDDSRTLLIEQNLLICGTALDEFDGGQCEE